MTEYGQEQDFQQVDHQADQGAERSNNFEAFMKKNKEDGEILEYAATQSLKDDQGKPLIWKFRKLKPKEFQELTEQYTKKTRVQRNGEWQKIEELDGISLNKAVIAKTCIVPNLKNAALQDSYGVMTPEDLLFEMLDSVGEYNALNREILKFNNMTTTMDDEVEEAKN